MTQPSSGEMPRRISSDIPAQAAQQQLWEETRGSHLAGGPGAVLLVGGMATEQSEGTAWLSG